jgi:hypothetical protein
MERDNMIYRTEEKKAFDGIVERKRAREASTHDIRARLSTRGADENI